jgi:signal transduction histidine kinase
LGIDKRRYSGFFDKLGSRDLLGIVEITDAGNPLIKDSTNRQDFEDNSEYRELKQFIIDQIGEIEDYLKFNRTKARQTTKSSLKGAHEDLKNFTKLVKEIKKKAPESLKEELDQLDVFTTRIGIDVNKGIVAFNELEAEKVKQENFFMSLMSLQDYALELAHVVRTSLSRIIRLADFFANEFPNPELDEFFTSYAKDIHQEMLKLESVVNFMLSYAKSDTDFREIDIKGLIENLFNNFYKATFEKNEIHAIAEIDKPLMIYHNQKFFEDIIENLISNSIKALQNVNHERIIKCTGIVEDDAFTLYFSDNGTGIAEDDKKRVFNIYFTRTAEQGGAGIGLYIVKTRIQSMKGTVEVVDNELKPTGTTLKITLPYANKS